MKKVNLVATAAALIFSTSMNAAVVTMNTNAAITTVNGGSLAGIGAGDSISIQFTYETTAPLGPQAGFVTYYNSNPFSIGFSTGGVAFSWESITNFIDVSDNLFIGTSQYLDQLWLNSTNAVSADQIGGLTPVRVDLTFIDRQDCFSIYCTPGSEVPMFNDVSIPDKSFNYERGVLKIWYASTLNAPDATINFDASFAAPVVPVPAAFWLFGSGLIGLISIARKKSGT